MRLKPKTKCVFNYHQYPANKIPMPWNSMNPLKFYSAFSPWVYALKFNERRTILVTGHRRESFGKGFENIYQAIKKIAKNNVQIIYPVH